jgi:transposase
MNTDVILLPDLTHLPDDAAFLKEIVVQLHGTIQDQDRRIQQLEQSLHLLVKRFLRPASEKIDPKQLLLFVTTEVTVGIEAVVLDLPAESVTEEPPEEKARPKHTPHGRQRIPDLLERKEVFHDLTPEQKLLLGGAEYLVCIGEDVTRKFEWIPSSVIVIEHHQKKYVRRETKDVLPGQESIAIVDDCVAHDSVPSAAIGAETRSAAMNPAPVGDLAEQSPVIEPVPESVGAKIARLPVLALTPELAARFASPVIVAPRPPEPIPGGIAGPGLLAQVIVSKYGDHLPLYRLERIFERQGVHFARQTLCDWCAGCATLLTPLADLTLEEVLRSFVIHTDDTPVRLRDAHAKEKLQARFWNYVGDEQHPLIWYEFTKTRKRTGPDRILADYTGYLQADGYGGYDGYEGIELSAESPILKVACWAHARRKFHDALRTELLPAQFALARIAQLYRLEKELRERTAGEWQGLSIEIRAALIASERRAHALPILAEFRKWLDQQAISALPKSPIGVAVRYALNQWSGLCRYVEDGRLSIDNNAAERALRGIAIGRKNWLFCGSEKGGRTAATLFTMISSAMRNDLDPWAYLRDVLTRLPALGASPDREELLPLLPHHWQAPDGDPTRSP